MLGWALTFLALALAAAYLGFFGFVGIAALIAKIFTVIFALALVLMAGFRLARGPA
jgi:uncharacterized membrane protein YtjA (UPF0391 family)